ncbi:hypothetical protein [Macrococcus equipercicus]|uniref:Uncharacterized protein n=1 Tax=Macrococcus equipercicus TaxID=69967 RepID=A0A9Q9F330_9STAP|nr:hypothetical protein [Macrococcus equipercicus]UTH13454.1 hypothetical protein KFV11_09505 [Macrococcus equipercicus]
MALTLSDVSLIEKALDQLVKLMSLKHPCIEDIVIGCQRKPEDYAVALSIKEAWEQRGGFNSEGGTVLDIVCWNEQSSSFNKYCSRIARHHPDAFVVVGMTAGFKEINRRLHKCSELTAEQTYVLGNRDGSLDSLFFHQLTGVSWTGEAWRMSQLQTIT